MTAERAAAHMRTMTKQILAITRRGTNETDVALPYTSDDDALAAWNWLKDNGRLLDVHDRPGEKVSAVRKLMFRYLKDTATVPPLPDLDGQMARLFIDSLYGAELNSRIHTLVEPLDGQ